MARVIIEKAKNRDRLAEKVAMVMSQVGDDNVISVTMSGASDGKIGGGGLLANYVAYIFVKG